MRILAGIAIGGAFGAVARYLVANLIHGFLGRGFPYGTLLVNLIGSFLMGLLSAVMLDRLGLSPEWRAAALTGILGAFTTFSTFSLETIGLLEDGQLVKATLNVALSVSLCLGGAWLGASIGRQL